jgi:hypothetical protein
MGYEKGKIYKLQCADGHYYYGSTINELRVRLQGHKYASRKHPYRVYQHINAVGWNTVTIELIESYPCENRRELNRKESEYIASHKTDPLCLNHIFSFITEEQKKDHKRQYTERNKEALAEYHRKTRIGNPAVVEYQRQYRETHKEDLKEKKRQYHALNKEQAHARARAWYLQNREQILAAKKAKYHAARANNAA